MGSVDGKETHGSCLCGASHYTFSGEPVATAICHCLTCRKLSSSAYTTDLLLPLDRFSMADGAPVKQVTVKHENGMPITVHFCSDCGGALYKEGDAEGFRGLAIVLAGNLHGPEGNTYLENSPQTEFWTKYRLGWTGEVKGAKQCVTFE